jgi:chromatin remodeling complex protein RSC6
LSKNEHEYIRACGTLDGFEEEDDEEIDEIEHSSPIEPLSSSRMPSGFVAPTLISDQLAQFLGVPLGTRTTRVDVSREINKYIRDKGLQDRENHRKINPDENLRALLRVSTNDEVSYFTLQKLMKHHFIR